MDDVPAAPAEYLEVSFDASLESVLNSTSSSVQNNAQLPFAVSGLFWAPVTSANCLTTGDDVKKVYDLQLDMKDCGFELVPGDTVGIFPNNGSEEVESLVERLGVLNMIDAVCKVCVQKDTAKKKASIPPHIPVTATLRYIFETCLDLHAVPKKLFVRALLEYTSDPEDRKALQNLCSRKSERYTEWISSGRSCIAALLSDYPSCRPPVSLLLEHLPRLQPRPYSIAFLSGTQKSQMHIAFSVVTYFSGGVRKTGVCSGWLEQITEGFRSSAEQPSLCAQMEGLSIDSKLSPVAKIPLFLRKSSGFHFPLDISRPLVMVGPGVGVAPFIGFLHQRERLLDDDKKPDKVAPCWLFFGCRYSGRDQLYSDELTRFMDTKTLNRCIMAYSRDRISPLYVQDNIRMLGRDVCQLLLEDDGYLFVCGDALNMARDVLATIIDAISKYRSISKAEAQKVVMELQEKGHYKEDVWTIQDDVFRMYSKAMADEKKRQAMSNMPPPAQRHHACDMV